MWTGVTPIREALRSVRRTWFLCELGQVLRVHMSHSFPICKVGLRMPRGILSGIGQDGQRESWSGQRRQIVSAILMTVMLSCGVPPPGSPLGGAPLHLGGRVYLGTQAAPRGCEVPQDGV